MKKLLIPILMLGFMGVSQTPVIPLQPKELLVSVPYYNTYEPTVIVIYPSVNPLIVPQDGTITPIYYSTKLWKLPTYKVNQDLEIKEVTWDPKQ